MTVDHRLSELRAGSGKYVEHAFGQTRFQRDLAEFDCRERCRRCRPLPARNRSPRGDGVVAARGLAGRKTFVPPRKLTGVILLVGALDMTANSLYVLATYAGYLSIAAVLTSLYPGSTVILARFVLGERLSPLQKTGVGLALAGVALIAL